MSPVVLFKHHGKAFGSGHIADALRSAGIDVIEVQTAKSLPEGSQVLVVGLGRLEQVPEVETFLRDAGERKITRLLWHLEPTLPPGVTGSGAKIVIWLLRDSTLKGKRGHLARTVDRLGCQALAAATRHQPWSNHVPVGEIFKYPLAQSPSLIKSWSEGLIDRMFVSLRIRREFLAERAPPLPMCPGWTQCKWCRRRDLNPRPTHYECVALPLSYCGFLQPNQRFLPMCECASDDSSTTSPKPPLEGLIDVEPAHQRSPMNGSIEDQECPFKHGTHHRCRGKG